MVSKSLKGYTTMKKLVSLFLALAIVFAMSIPAFADENTTLTITNSDGRSYVGYKLLNLTTSLKTGEHHAVALAHLAGERLQAAGMRVANRRHAQNWNADSRDDEAHHGLNHIAARNLSQMYRENEVPRAKEHTEKRHCHQNSLLLKNGLVSFSQRITLHH